MSLHTARRPEPAPPSPTRDPVTLMLLALRPHQWVKNLLLLVPLALAHQILDPLPLVRAILGTLTFCLVASAGYLVNDLLDSEADRHDPEKRRRPFASGRLPRIAGIVGAVVLTAIGFALAAFISRGFVFCLAGYLTLSLAYSLALKRQLAMDVILLGCLYAGRVVAGGVAAAVALSHWFIVFCVFFFLSLALSKRVGELVRVRREAKLRLARRDYGVSDLHILSSLGGASGYLSVLVFALYLHGGTVQALYRAPEALWFIVPLLLYWVTRIWTLTLRGGVGSDPVLFTLRDPNSYVVMGLVALTFWAAA